MVQSRSNRNGDDFETIKAIYAVVAVHGLNGHREETWTADNGVNWLRHLLPQDLPHARILSWGYDANTHGPRVSCQYLYDHARSLVADLCRKRKLTNSTERPIIFVAHSLGGIIVKSALIHSDTARQGALHEHRSVKVATHGIIFMGTPHQGGNGVQLGRLLANVASLFVAADNRILQHLERDSEWLQQQLGQYGPISGDFITKFAYEEYETPTAFGHKIMVVPRASAVVPGQADAEPIVIHADHHKMVKFFSKEDIGYVTISEHLQIMISNAESNVRSRWEAEARVAEAREDNVYKFSLALNLSDVIETTCFVAREEEFVRMHGILKETHGRRIVTLHGLGGIGKTQLAIAYIQRYHREYSATIWLNARDETSLKQSFARAANRILREHQSVMYVRNAVDSQDLDEIVQAVKRWLDQPHNDNWLVVYDNYDEPKLDHYEEENANPSDTSEKRPDNEATGRDEIGTSKAFDIRPFLPENYHGAIVITTRSSTVEIGQQVSVGKLKNIDDGLVILGSMSNRRNLRQDVAAVEVARLLDGLPLALSTAGAYLKLLTTSWAEYLTLYRESWLRLQKSSPKLSSYDRALYSTWNISYAHVKRRNLSSANLLRLWAYFDKEDLWFELLRSGRSGAALWFQELTQDRLNFDQMMKKSVEPEDADGWITMAFGNLYLDQGRFEDAEAMYERALRGQEKAWGPEHTPTLDAVNNLGNLYKSQDRFDDAEAMYERALRGYEKIWGPEHTSALITVNNLGILYTDQGRFDDAEAMYERALRGYEKTWGPEHTSTLHTLNNLGNLYKSQDRFDDAEAI
ncbi:hypothetical protein DL768_007626 [Monosporascus sp. mg162]|nr:hypothetical protein DL768_007626 [Monosporascus sp. mg162]